MSKKTIAIIAGIIVVLALGVFAFFALSGKAPSNDGNVSGNVASENSEPSNIENQNDPGNYRSVLPNQTSETTTVTNVTNASNEPVNQSETSMAEVTEKFAHGETQDYSVSQEDMAVKQREFADVEPNRTEEPYLQHSMMYQEEQRMATVDKERAKNVARDFVNAFYFYNQEILSSGMYTASYSGLIDSAATSSTGSSKLIYIHSNREWQQALSTYPQVYCAPTSVEVGEPNVSAVTHKGTVSVPVTLIVDRNQGDPPGMQWYLVNTYKLGLAVYLDDSYQVIDVREQTSEMLNVDIFNAA